MLRKLSLTEESTFTSGHIALNLTLKLQRAMGDGAVGNVPRLIKGLPSDMEVLNRLVGAEAEAIAQFIENKTRLPGVILGSTVVARHYDSRNFAVDSKGSKAYARVEITSTFSVPQSQLMGLTDQLLNYFWEFMHEQVVNAERGIELPKEIRLTAMFEALDT